MDKNKIKAFAIWARKSLISAVSEKANRIGIYENNIEKAQSVQGGFKLEGKDEIFPLSNSHRDALVNKIREKGFEEVMEEVAYTWFNRFMGLRYMEVNDYLPTGVRILSSEVEGKVEPDALTKVSEIIDELNLNANEIYDLLDTGNTLDREKAYRIILVKQCNELGKIIPQMFEKISDYTELLLPDNLLEEGSVIRKMVEDIEEADWKEEVEIIGWMYQYYISEKKDEVFAALKKNVKITKENIPAATQLFTPKWIVKYMVENSLGRLWLEGHPNEELQSEWKYYLEEAEQEPEVEEELKKIRAEHAKLKPEDIKVLDPCMGSGHILVYAFDVLYEIYKTAGYSEREIPRMILQNNLYGLDIDDRAAQLASFALIMKARLFNRRLFREIEREHLELNLCSIQESNSISKEAIDYFCISQFAMKNSQLAEVAIDTIADSKSCVISHNKLRKDIEYLTNVFTDAKEYGSILEVEKVNFESLKQRLKEIEQENNLMFADYRKMLLDKLPMIIKQAEMMSRKYEVCVTNPPYIGNNGMGVNLSNYVKKTYPNSKFDLFAIFIEKCSKMIKNGGLQSMITQHSWMFLSSYEKFREKIMAIDIINMAHLGPRAFEEIGGEVVQTTSFVMRNSDLQKYRGAYVRLVNYNSQQEKENNYLKSVESIKINNNCFNIYFVCKSNFSKIAGSPVAYWVSDKYYNLFEEKCISDTFIPKFGMSVGDGERFIRFWYEVNVKDIEYDCKNEQEFMDKNKKWNVMDKGGSYRRWYGNKNHVVFWKNNGKAIKEHPKAAVRSPQYFFKPHISWTLVSSGKYSARYFEDGYVLDTASNCLYFNCMNRKEMVLGYLNTTIGNEILKILNPTLNYSCGVIGAMPYKDFEDERIKKLVNDNIYLSKSDWDSFETSWDFKIHPLIKFLDEAKDFKLSSSFEVWESKCEANFNQLKANEKELNKIFIDIYGLQDELTPEVEDKDITIRKSDRERDIKSFISYAVGCMFGRYSIDSEGLIYAGGEFSDKWLVSSEQCKVRKIVKDDDGNVISDSWVDANFMPDIDNIIPITEDEYFEDDIVSRFIDFVRTVYGEETLEENLDFIADSIGRKASETARQAIRRYFIKDFYKDHLKVYQKRPIYWMFDSGKNDGFKALIYMHRYNEQTVAKVRTDYLHTLQRKYESEINRLKLVVDSEEYTAKDRTAAKKKIARISKQLEECKEYDQVVAHLANEKISIDLDDGVKVNYAKFQDIKVINSKGKEVKMNLLSKI